MNLHYEARIKEAKDISDKIKDISDAVMIVGSVAYNPDVVHEKTDLDMVVIFDCFSNFEELHKRLGVEYNGVADTGFKSGTVDVFTINTKKDFPVGISVWEPEALDKIVTLSKEEPIRILREHGFNRPSQSEILQSFSGEIYPKAGKREAYQGQVLQTVHQYKEVPNSLFARGDIFMGVMMNNLLLNPVVLHQEDDLMDFHLKQLDKNLRWRVKEIYGTTKHISIKDALPQKIAEQLPYESVLGIDSRINP
ncbi:hypothetical protein JXB27_03265 [Candidatus Woesearchaeota archaeon]|nr:hypothetical protein [Candidatus Woesearchaeota archaeon]